MNSFNVCTYNIGSSTSGDYFQLCKHLESIPILKSREDDEAFLLKYNAIQKKTAELLNNKAEVYCLQEVGNEERPLIQSLKERNFEIIHLNGEKGFDTAIALDTSRFSEITNHSINVEITRNFRQDVAIATATHILSGKQITFVSAHTPGFDFTKEINTKDTAEGDFYCRAIVEKLSHIGHSNMQIIGADMNANPERLKPLQENLKSLQEEYESRFEIFSNQNFQLHRTNLPTNVNPQNSEYQEREIDFIFIKKSISVWEKIKSFFTSSIQLNAKIATENSIGWNLEHNASDHLPVFTKVSYTFNASKIRQLWDATRHSFSSCFRSSL